LPHMEPVIALLLVVVLAFMVWLLVTDEGKKLVQRIQSGYDLLHLSTKH